MQRTRYLVVDPGLRLQPWAKRSLIAGALALSIAVGCAAGAAGATCTPIRNAPATIDNVARYPNSRRYQVTLSTPQRQFAVITTTRRFRVGQQVTVSGCVDRWAEILNPRVR